jgi:hypothetical protein
MEQGDADIDSPLHAAGEFAHPPFLAVGQADEAQHLVNASVQGRAAQAVHLTPKG